jgi:hypothetical protein
VALFGGAVGKDTVSRVWRKAKGDWDVWNARLLADEPIVRLILDGTVVRVRLDKQATSISLLVGLGVRQDGQKVLLAVKNMGRESEAAWRALDDLVKRGLKTPGLVIVDGASGLEKALAALWSDMPVQRCTVHKNRNLLAHAPDRLHEEISADYKHMIYAETKQEKAFIRKWRLKRRAVALIAWRKQETSFSPSRAFLKANGSRSEHRMQSNDCTRSSSGGSRRRPCCLPQKPPPCCSGLCWPLARLRCARQTVGKVSPRSLAIKSLTSPHDRVTSSRWRSRQNQFQHKLLRHLRADRYIESGLHGIVRPISELRSNEKAEAQHAGSDRQRA